jgi:hypothetical protein
LPTSITNEIGVVNYLINAAEEMVNPTCLDLALWTLAVRCGERSPIGTIQTKEKYDYIIILIRPIGFGF